MKFPKYGFAVLFSLILLLFTGWLLADTFLIPHAYTVVASEPMTETEAIVLLPTESEAIEQDPAQEPETVTPASTPIAPVTTETSYTDENIQVALSTYRLSDTTVYVADVTLSSADYLKTAFAQSTYGRNITATTSATASAVNAILAINGDYYGAQRSGYVIRNGVLYRSRGSGGEDLVIYADGSFGIIDEDEISAQALLDAGAWNVLSFGPALVENYAVSVSQNDEVGKAMASNPRTAIGILSEGHYLFVVADGRTNESEGLTLYELATFLQSLGVETAYNLDGGGSSSMVFLGNVINNPTSGGRNSGERSVSDIVYIGYDA